MEERQLIRVEPQHLDKRTRETRFIAGTAVEVSLPDEHCHDAWFPATLIKEVKNDFFLVQYSCLRLSGGENFLKDVVDALHIRPSPPPNLQGNRFDVLDEVDAFFGFGWWTGVVTEVRAGDRYIVQFEHQKESREFSQFELRPYFKWINPKCLQASQDREGEDRKTDMALLLCSGKSEGIDLADESDMRKRKVKDFMEEPCKKLKEVVATEGSLSLMAGPTPASSQEKFGNDLDCNRSRPQKVCDSALSPLSMTNAVEGDSFETQDQFLQKCASVQSSSHDTKSLGGDEINQQGGAGKLTSAFLETEMQSTEMVSEASGVDPENKTPNRDTADAIQTECMSKGTEITVTEGFSNIEIPQPLSMCFEESHSGVSIDRGVSPDREIADAAQTDCASEGTDTIMTSALNNIEEVEALGSCIASTDNRVSPDNRLVSMSNMEITSRDASLKDLEDENQNKNLPFVKSCPVWKNVESMEVFRLMAQHPHFQPLQQKEELLREGLAIGYMVSFFNVVNKTERAELDEPKSALEKTLDVLVELEDVGFNVEPVRERLKELIEVKESQLQLGEKLKQVKEELILRKHEEELLKLEADEMSEKLREMEKSINKLAKEREKFVMEKESKGSNIVAFQGRLHEIKKTAENAKLDFSRVAAAPW